MTEDKEIQAMSRVSEALRDLDEETQARVLRWAGERYRVSTAKPRASGADSWGGDEPATPQFKTLADLYHAAAPTTDMQRALVAGYWLQVVEGQETFESQPMNTQLKQLGHGVRHVAKALSRLIALKPSLVIQVQKSGQTQQARKKYKLTTAGINRVKNMLSGMNDEEER